MVISTFHVLIRVQAQTPPIETMTLIYLEINISRPKIKTGMSYIIRVYFCSLFLISFYFIFIFIFNLYFFQSL